jgi:virginiamycin B lyase
VAAASGKRGWTVASLIAVLASLLLATNAFGASRISTPGFPLAPGVRALSITLGPGGDIWFTGNEYAFQGVVQGKIGRVTPDGQVTEFGVPTQKRAGRSAKSSAAWSITDGPDGNLWFAGASGGVNEVGRITPSGQLTQFDLPEPASAATEITNGPDGNLWFTERVANKIGRITPNGQFTEFSLPPGAGPHGITVGPDSALWFTESDANRIGRIDPSGLVSEFPLSGPTSRPNEITLGPDGDLWFTETAAPKTASYSPSLADQIGRITPEGKITMFEVEARWPGTGALTAGPGGRIWFATGTGSPFEHGMSSTPEIGWITPEGETAPPACVPPFCGYPANSLAVGLGGLLWFGLDTAYNNGGGGSGFIGLQQPGYVGTYSPPPVTLGIGIPPVGRGGTTIEVRCEEASSCRGSLSLRSSYGSKPPTVGHGRYAVAPDTSAVVALRLNRTAKRLLKKEKRLRVVVSARSRQGHAEQSRVVELRPPQAR